MLNYKFKFNIPLYLNELVNVQHPVDNDGTYDDVHDDCDH